MPLSDAVLSALSAVVGPDHVLTAPEARAPFEQEWRGRFPSHAEAVVRPGSTAEVSAVMALCHEARVPVVPQGGNTGLVGGAVADGGLIVTLGRMDRVRAVDAANFTMTVDAGCILETLHTVAADHDRLFPLSLGAQGTCQIGGNLATNAGGVQVLRYGNARELTLGLEVVLADGRVLDDLNGLRKNNTGYALSPLFVGSEGTLGLITGAVLKLFPRPAQTETALVALPDEASALTVFQALRAATGDALTACEVITRFPLELVLAHVAGTRDPFAAPHPAYLLVEAVAGRPDTGLRIALEDTLAAGVEGGSVADAVLAESETQRQALWRLRETIPEAQTREGASIKHDVAVPTSAVPAFLREAEARVQAAMPGIRCCPFGHLGDGNLHFNLTQPRDMTAEAFLARWDHMNALVHGVVAEHHGTISAEHGIGLLKRDLLPRYKNGVALEVMAALRAALDPRGILNPGKLLIP